MLVKVIMIGVVFWIVLWCVRQYQQPAFRLQIGTQAPDFKLPDAQGKIRNLSEWQGQWLVLYFYPKDDTPGCTREACYFRDDSQALTALGAQVVGVSVDTVASHADFVKKHRLPFPLLADTTGKVAAAYGALFDLVVFRVARRMTFIIDPQGKVAQVYSQVDPDGHSQMIVADLKKLSAF